MIRECEYEVSAILLIELSERPVTHQDCEEYYSLLRVENARWCVDWLRGGMRDEVSARSR